MCPICEVSTEKLWKIPPFDLCPGCGLRIRRLEDPQNQMEQLYNSSWQAPDQFKGETGATDIRLAKIYMENLTKELGIQSLVGLKILDFGAGKGELLQVLREMGAVVYGVEPFGYDRLVEQGFSAFKSLEEAIPYGPFDGIVSVDVLEHLIHPLADVISVQLMLKDGGWFYLATPNSGSLRARLTEEKWEEALRKGHLFLFSAEGLNQLLKKTGFICVKRIRWVIRYNTHPIKMIINSLLTGLSLDGELRYLAFKSKINLKTLL